MVAWRFDALAKYVIATLLVWITLDMLVGEATPRSLVLWLIAFVSGWTLRSVVGGACEK